MEAMMQVRKGMHVRDASGEDVGVVEDFKMGDANAATAEGQTVNRRPGIIENFARGLVREDREVSEQEWERLMRIGYIRVDGSGLFGGYFYVAADRVDRVDGDTVHLAFTRTE